MSCLGQPLFCGGQRADNDNALLYQVVSKPYRLLDDAHLKENSTSDRYVCVDLFPSPSGEMCFAQISMSRLVLKFWQEEKRAHILRADTKPLETAG